MCMFDCSQFRELIVIPALSKIKGYSKEAEELLIFTCAVESGGGTYLKQIRGPALGVYQMEPDTYTDLWQNYIHRYPAKSHMLALHMGIGAMPLPDKMVSDLQFATAMARFHYMRHKEPLPDHNDIDAIWLYYKKYWNTSKGKARKDVSVKNYAKFVR